MTHPVKTVAWIATVLSFCFGVSVLAQVPHDPQFSQDYVALTGGNGGGGGNVTVPDPLTIGTINTTHDNSANGNFMSLVVGGAGPVNGNTANAVNTFVFPPFTVIGTNGYAQAGGNGILGNSNQNVYIGIPDPNAFLAGPSSIFIGFGTGKTGSISSEQLGIGNSVKIAGANSIAIGNQPNCTGTIGCTTVGEVSVGGTEGSAFGGLANANFTQASAFGWGANANNTFATSAGAGAISNGSGGSSFGFSSVTQDGLAAGQNANSNAPEAVALGPSTTATGLQSTTAGYASQATGIRAASYGYLSVCSGTSSSCVGSATTCAFNNSSAIGESATCTAANQMMFGTVSQTPVFPGPALFYSSVSGAQHTPVTKTSAYTLVTTVGSSDSDKSFNNNGAGSSVAFSLPNCVTATFGYHARFYNTNTNGFTLAATNGTDTITVAGAVQTSSTLITTVVKGSSIDAECTVAGAWYTRYSGTFTSN